MPLPLNLPPKESAATRTDRQPATETPPEEPPAVGEPAALQMKGRLGKNYLLAENANGLVVVDLRLARQRIIFERFLKNLNSEDCPRQPLLLPESLNLSPDESRFLKGELEHFAALGFTIEPFGGHTYLVTSVPANLPDDQDVSRTIRDIIEDLRQNHVTSRQNAVHLAQIAARHAARLSKDLSDAELSAVLKELWRCEMPYVCPNGHPTMLHFTYAELERRFKNS